MLVSDGTRDERNGENEGMKGIKERMETLYHGSKKESDVKDIRNE